ncbi:MAG: MFS transporter [Pseudomonadota bacterium]
MTTSHPKTESTRYRYYVLGMLTIVYTFNFVDRQLIAILSPAIQEELGLSDTTLGLLKGFAFALLYSVLGIPIAWLADRWNRISIISIALAVWSGFTALSGLAANTVQLAIARVGVGVGEAGCSPPAHSVISDYFSKEERASAISIYSLGIPFGQMFAFLAGGWVLENLGWRNAFFIVGIPGVLLAVLVKLTLREPMRGAQETDAPALDAKIDYRKGLKQLLSIPSYWGVIVGTTFASLTGYGTALWIVDFYRRTFELSYTEITVPLAFLNGVIYGVGTYMGGYLTDRFGKSNKAVYALFPGIAMAITIPFGWASVWAPTPVLSFSAAAFFLFCIGIYLGPSFALAQTLAPVRLRAFSTAFLFLVLNLVALSLGPFWVGALSDSFAGAVGEIRGLQYAMTTLAIFSLCSAAAYWWTSKRLPADWQAANEEDTP